MNRNSFYYRKLHSLLGVIPLGAFLIEHLLTNYEAFNKGKEGFIEAVFWIRGLPMVLALEIFFIWLPLLYHGVYGLYVAYQSRNNVSRYGTFRNVMFMLQRVTGVVTFVFVTWHIYNTRFQITLGDVTYAGLAEHMPGIASNPLYFALYCIGIIAAVFHFSNGMWSFLVSWGITVGPRAQRVSTFVWMIVFVTVSTMFILSLSAFTDESFALLVDSVTT